MKKRSILVVLLKFFGIMLVGWFIFLMIFAILGTEGDEEISDFQSRMSLLLGFLLSLIIVFGIKFNGVRRRFETLKATRSNIGISEETNNGLLDKANRVVEKYMAHESDVQLGVSQIRSAAMEVPKKSKKVKSADQFRTMIENYPDLKANEAVNRLLVQIEQCENTLESAKRQYNDSVLEYNTLINNFPTVLLKKICRWKEMEYYSEPEEEITDEMLGL